MKVAVAGSTGFIGSALVEALKGGGHEVVRLVRREPRGAGEVRWQPGSPLDPAALAGVDAAVNLAGAGVGDKRWTPAYKKVLLDSRVGTTQTLATALAAGLELASPLRKDSISGVFFAAATVRSSLAPSAIHHSSRASSAFVSCG